MTDKPNDTRDMQSPFYIDNPSMKWYNVGNIRITERGTAMKLTEIHIRDPFVLLHQDMYYLYGSRGGEAWGAGTGLDVYTSEDLTDWHGPIEVFRKPDGFWADLNFWAPEVHAYKGRFYMFASFKSADKCRGTQILATDDPKGPFRVHSDGPVTPDAWECLDGTLYIRRDGTPFMVFCHEWVQVGDGKMCAVQLAEDLRTAVGEPFVLFEASEPVWADKGGRDFITDGPFLYRAQTGGLLMVWSTFTEKNGYVAAIAHSDNGELDGRWRHQEALLFADDGGHGMLFTGKDGGVYFILHSPNAAPHERPRIKQVYEANGTLCTKAVE